ncbi:hypothetical protein Bbelb_186670 [Branchiostoma belcheri]|nr:hypothetical protein Bbelb_186670 [Branchiostoma belcheri]
MCTHKTVATLSQRCFEEAEGIMQKWEEGSWPNQKTTRVSQSLFRELNSDGGMAHYIFRKRVNDLIRALAVDFNQHLYVPEVNKVDIDESQLTLDQRDQLAALLKKHKNAFAKDGSDFGFTETITTPFPQGTRPRQERYRRIPHALYQPQQVATLQQATMSQKATPLSVLELDHVADMAVQRNKRKERQDQGLVSKPYNLSIHDTEEQHLKLRLKTDLQQDGIVSWEEADVISRALSSWLKSHDDENDHRLAVRTSPATKDKPMFLTTETAINHLSVQLHEHARSCLEPMAVKKDVSCMAFHAEKVAEGYEFDFVPDMRTTILEAHINGPLGQRLAYMHHVVLDLLHEGHLGQEKTKTKARDILFWPGMCSQIDEKVSMGSICQENRTSNRKEPMIPHQGCDLSFSHTTGWPSRSHREACDKMDVSAWHMGLVIPEVYIKISQHPYQKT